MEATLGGVRVRFRPLIMTSMAFFFGVLPLAIATGAGAGAMNAIGTAVTGGMLSAAFIDLFYIPLLFALIYRAFKGKQLQDANDRAAIPPLFRRVDDQPQTLPTRLKARYGFRNLFRKCAANRKEEVDQ